LRSPKVETTGRISEDSKTKFYLESSVARQGTGNPVNELLTSSLGSIPDMGGEGKCGEGDLSLQEFLTLDVTREEIELLDHAFRQTENKASSLSPHFCSRRHSQNLYRSDDGKARVLGHPGFIKRKVSYSLHGVFGMFLKSSVFL